MSTNDLPPLPEPFVSLKTAQFAIGENVTSGLFTADQMQAYARAAVEAERKRISSGLNFEHLYDGDCPDEVAPNSRDPNCPACRTLVAFGNGAFT